MFITHGLSGSGKTWLGRVLSERLPLIQIRSDVERKRLFAVLPDAQASGQTSAQAGGQTGAISDSQLYSRESSRLTYQRLLELAREILHAGCSVLVDAAFLQADQRQWFRALAQHQGCSFHILALSAAPDVLKERVANRLQRGNDASDADPAVLARQHEKQQPLNAAEQACATYLNTQSQAQIAAFLRRMSQT